MGDVKLLGIVGSPFVMRAQIALNLKGVKYEFLEQDLQNKSELLLKSNPVHKKVPVLIHKGKPIAESNVIVEYIDETWKHNPILPTDPYQRAMARFWTKFLDDECGTAVYNTIHVYIPDEKEREKNIKKSLEALQFVENEIKGKFFGGDKFGYLDIAALFYAFWLPIFEEIAGFQLVTSERFPKLYRWGREVVNYPVVKENLPPREPLLGFFKGLYYANVNGAK